MLTNKKKQEFEFYTEDKDGIETIHGVKALMHPDKCKLFLTLEKEGFKDNRVLFGYRTKTASIVTYV